MRRHKAKSLQWHFITKSLLVCLLVSTATLAALAQLTNGYFTQNHLIRSIELARAIDSIAMVTTTPEHIQQYVDSSTLNDQDMTIRVIDKDTLRVVATNRRGEYRSWLSGLSDSEVVSITRNVIKTGRFSGDLTTSTGRQLTILPLTSIRHTRAQNVVRRQVKALKPAWHQNLKLHSDTVTTWLSQLLRSHQHVTNSTFTVPQAKFSGVIVIENRKHWTASLRSDTFQGIALLICGGFILLIASGYYFAQRYVLHPVNALSEVLRQQRKGQTAARAARSPVSQFDHLARQWNGLLNYRQAAEERQRVLSKVLEHTPIGIEVTNPASLIEYANPAYLKMTGHSLIDVLGKSPDQLLGSENADPELLKSAQVEIRQGRKWRAEYPSRRKDGSEFTSEVTLHPIMSEDGQLERIVAVRQDVTARREYEDSLIEAKQLSEAAERSKTEFIARMSHELRTPFNSIIGFADIIAKQQLGPVGNETYLEFARIIEQSATGLLAIINSIIDLSRMAAGQRPLDEVTVNLHSLAKSVVRNSLKEPDKDRISINIHDKLNGWGLTADERMVKQMISNLVSNAIKFNKDDGQVDITLRRDRQSRVVLEVKDNGIGMSKSELQDAVKPFVQLHQGYDRAHEGIGLGLTLVENQIAAHDAKLKITSREGHGTKVKVIFPSYRTIKPITTKHKQSQKEQDQASGQEAA